MERPEAIEYVQLTGEGTGELAGADISSSFWFERNEQVRLPDPGDDPAHRHNFHEIIFVLRGHGRHTIDGHAAALTPFSVALIAKGQVHRVEAAQDLAIYLLRFTDDFLPADLVSPTWDYHAMLFNHLGLNQTLQLAAPDAEDVIRCLALVEHEYAGEAAFQRNTALRHLLAVLIIRLGRIVENTLGPAATTRAAVAVYQAFVPLLEQHFADRHDVQYYAAALHLAPAKLSRHLHTLLGKTTKQIIDERVILEAKRLLQYTPQTIGEIAYALGYSDQFHLSKTFKRLVGVAPQEYRDQWRKST
jgi:AraC-like DNA-binding protein/mannose-6-phosphate isomerase-like protein (cupin superfamily)